MTRPSSPPPAASTRLSELDALRAVAALAVVLFHYTWRAPTILPGVVTIADGFSPGRFGVHLFFAISGFVIFMTLERTRSAADFAVSRFARLFPAYWAGIALTTLGIALLDVPELAQPRWVVLANLSMLQGFMYWPDVDGVYWSLSVELAFYAVMLALWRLGWLARIERVLIGWIALTLLWKVIPALPSRLEAVLALRYIPWFAIGMVAYRLRQHAANWRAAVPVLALGWIAVWYTGKPYEAAVYPLVIVIFGALIAGKLRWLDRRALVWLGGLSYPLYLVHQNLGYALILRLEQAGLSPAVATAIALLAALLVAQAVHSLIETPALTATRGWWKARHAAPLIPAPQ